jgi:hypothetical protein
MTLFDFCRWDMHSHVKKKLENDATDDIFPCLQFCIEADKSLLIELLLKHYEKHHLHKAETVSKAKLEELTNWIDNYFYEQAACKPEIYARLYRYKFAKYELHFLDDDAFRLCDCCLMDADMECIQTCLEQEMLHGALLFAVISDNPDLIDVLITHYEAHNLNVDRESMEYKTALYWLKSCLHDALAFCEQELCTKTKSRLKRYVEFEMECLPFEYCSELTCAEHTIEPSLFCAVHSSF